MNDHMLCLEITSAARVVSKAVVRLGFCTAHHGRSLGSRSVDAYFYRSQDPIPDSVQY